MTCPLQIFTFALYDKGEGRTMSGIPSLAVARAIAADFYRRPAEWDSFIDEMIPKQKVIVDFVEDRLLFGYSIDDPFGSIAIEQRCGCCGHTLERRTVTRGDLEGA